MDRPRERRRFLGLRRSGLLLVVAIVGLIVGGGGLLLDQISNQNQEYQVNLTNSLQLDATQVTQAAAGLRAGIPPDFARLKVLNSRLNVTVQALSDFTGILGGFQLGKVQQQIGEIGLQWASVQSSLSSVRNSEAELDGARRALQIVEREGRNAQKLYSGIIDELASSKLSRARIAEAARQLIRIEKIRLLGRQLLGENQENSSIAAELANELNRLGTAHDLLIGADAISRKLSTGRAPIDAMSRQQAQIARAAKSLQGLQASATELEDGARNLTVLGEQLAATMRPLRGSSRFIDRRLILAALAVAVVALTLYVILSIIWVRRRFREASETDSRQQAAILTLLDDIGSLADGDLTVHADVTSDFTGAIADSINFAVETLRSLVGTLHETANEIGSAGDSTQETATLMESTSDMQAKEMVDIANRIRRSAESLTEMANNAEDISKQASNSVEVAHNGASTVGRMILGMAALREQIQDTSKRIKRLGESSQEIGNIIEFINDIAEQTNTLALNASIQAAMAGESGRGFAQVADEVQQLAERAAGATRQIETLVKTIQADTNEAIISMERSTSNVVSGAKSAEEAGQALTDIESTSQQLAELIQRIAGQSRGEAGTATQITGQVAGIRESAFQTAESARNTAQAVGELNALSVKLRETVAGFRLPDNSLLSPEQVQARDSEPDTARTDSKPDADPASESKP